LANQVQFLRTNGSLRQANATETGASGAAAEVFNYGPGSWLAQPPGGTASDEYDSITSLPPIL